MKFYADLHCHTKYSDGRNTVGQMIRAAADKGLKKLAITDHGPNNIGTGVFSEDTYKKIKKDILVNPVDGLEVLLGAEANVVDLNGTIDISEEVLQELDWLIIGLHPFAMPVSLGAASQLMGNQLLKLNIGSKEKVKEANTQALVAAINRYHPHCVSHPGLDMELDLVEVAKACVANNSLFEINTGHKFQQVEEIIQVAKTGVNFVVNSDSHYVETVGELAWGGELLTRAGVSVERVYNGVKEVR